MTEHQLVTTDSALCIIEEPEDDNVFRIFRRVYMAERCQKRVVYWYESKFGQTILRQRLHEVREAKKFDKAVSTFRGLPNIDALRLSIAASQSQRLMTGIRWEIYADFACTELVQTGRFDAFDLLGDADLDRLRDMGKKGEIRIPSCVQDWDFDAFFLTHRCPLCKKTFGKESLVFNPDFCHCPKCKKDDETTARHEILSKAIKLLRLINDEPEGVLNVPIGPNDRQRIEYMLDVHATPLFAWLCGLPPFHKPLVTMINEDLPTGLNAEPVKRCYRKSLFPLFKIQTVADEFERFFRQQTEDLIRDLESRPANKFLPGMNAEQTRAWSIRQNRQSIKDLQEMVRAVQQYNAYTETVLCSRADRRNWGIPLADMWERIRYLPLYMDDALIQIGKQLTSPDGKERTNI